LDRFEGMETQVLGLSVDSVPCLKAWAESLGGVTYPLLSDFYPHGQVAEKFGVLRSEGYTERAIFVVDKRGIIRYIDVHEITKQPNNDELFRVLNVLEPALAQQMAPTPAGAAAPQAPAVSAPEPRPGVVLYCTAWCPDCRRARAYLKDHSIDFVEIDIGRDREAAGKVRGWANGNETTPTFAIHDTIVVGYNTTKLNAALGIQE
jgi:glutaredoxin